MPTPSLNSTRAQNSRGNPLRLLSRWVFVAVTAVLLLGGGAVRAADADAAAFKSARAAFQDGFYSRAENAFSNFVARFPESPLAGEARLYQGRAALEQKRFQPAASILATNLARAGGLTDQYEYWLGRVQFESGNAAAAVDTFARVAAAHTNSHLRLNAALAEAQARFSLQQWSQVTQVIDQPGGAFQVSAAVRGTNDPLVVRGHLLLAQAWLEQRQFARAEEALGRISESITPPQLRWEREFLLNRVLFASRRLEQALASSTNLIAAAGSDADLRAAAVAVQGEILQALDRPADAMKAFEANLASNVPAPRRREAFLRTVELALEQNQVSNAVQRLESYLASAPAEAGSDVALLALAELRLKQHVEAPATGSQTTNLANLALADLSRLIRDFPQSPFLPRAHLARGWALLLQDNNADSMAAFVTAADTLEFSEAQAVARFKLADLQFAAGNLTNAVANYRRVIHDYIGLPRVQRELVDRALYQMLQASVAVGDIQSAEEAVKRVVADYPSGVYADRSLLLFGQALTDLAKPAEARRVFESFHRISPGSPLLPEVKLAIARSYEKERNWSAAAAQYTQWIESFPTNQNRAEAEFSRALATYHSGAETNALTYFTNFVARFSTNVLAARAQNWIGDYHFRRAMLNRSDEDFRDAEASYQLVTSMLATNHALDELRFAAQLKAGRAAFRRQGWSDAGRYFTNLINEPNCPPSIAVEAVFAWADTYVQQPNTNVLDRFRTPLRIVGIIPQNYPNDVNVPRAWGRMGDFSFQLAGLLATTDPDASAQAYSQAYDLYSKVTNSPLADIASYSLATLGMGHVRRKQAAAAAEPQASAYIADALNHYLDVVYAPDDERPDPILVRDAALEAARICEEQKNWSRALDLYTRVGEMIPSLRSTMEKRAAATRERQAKQ